MTNTTEIAKRVWGAIYPDRRPWDKLEPDTQKEWVRFTESVISIYEEDLINNLKML